MHGQLSLGALAEQVQAQTIDTVVAAFPDMQGRLVGKRFHAGYFCESAHEETHGCDYLLACDIDMEPVPGYQVASWQRSEEHTSELQSQFHLVCRLLLEKKKLEVVDSGQVGPDQG